MSEAQSSDNLDYLAAKHSQKLVASVSDKGILEIAITKMLGILQQNGVYGFFLFALSKKTKSNKDAEKKSYDNAITEARNLLKETLGKSIDAANLLKDVSDKFCRDSYINHLAQTVLERYLIYARYHAKGEKETG